MKQNYYPHFRGQNWGTERLGNLAPDHTGSLAPESMLYCKPLSPSRTIQKGYKVILQFLGDAQIGYLLKRKKKNWLYYTVIENRFPNRKPISFQCLKNPENYKQNLSNFYKNSKGVHDPQMVQIKSLLQTPTDKPQLAFIHTTYLTAGPFIFK